MYIDYEYDENENENKEIIFGQSLDGVNITNVVINHNYNYNCNHNNSNNARYYNKHKNYNKDNNGIKIQYNMYCTNCNEKGHTFKNCSKSIISNGIICIHIEDFKTEKYDILEMFILNELKNNTLSIPEQYNLSEFKNYQNTYELKNINDKIKFLMIQRKNSLGFLEIMRGKYNFCELDTIVKLLEQITNEELNDIKNNDFDNLWYNLWNDGKTTEICQTKEFISSKQKFIKLKSNYIHLLDSVEQIFKFKEWGFPKGRRNQYESNEICAIREFEEETGINENKYTILDKCGYVTEELIGTNGVNYAHNYYIAIISDYVEDDIKIDNKEVGDIKMLNINECLNMIRPYHVNKKKLVEKIYDSINKFLCI